MDTINSRAPSNASVFEASSKEPEIAITYALEEVDNLLAKYRDSNDILDRMALLTEIEALRRFVLVRGALTRGLSQPGRNDERPMGKQLCETLQGMIGDVPNLVKACSLQGARNMERDTRRAIASLNFLGSLNPSFI
jgi:hypothetical protein